jgi:hypothetical protein
MNEAIDVVALVRDIRATAEQITALKRALRTRWLRPMADEQRALCRLRRRATELCVLRAWSRGRRHLTRAPRDGFSPLEAWEPDAYHRRVAERVGASYARAAE